MIFIIKGQVQGRGQKTLEFCGAAPTREKAFELTSKLSGREFYKSFELTQYDLSNACYVGSSEVVAPYQKFTNDGHLDPADNRDAEGLCKSRGVWGPYCGKCSEIVFAQLSMALAKSNPAKLK